MFLQIFVLQTPMAPHVTGFQEIHGLHLPVGENVPLMTHHFKVTITIVLRMVYVPIAA